MARPEEGLSEVGEAMSKVNGFSLTHEAARPRAALQQHRTFARLLR
jgi:hypothetical protein